MELTKTQYNTIHVWVLRHYVKTGICEKCGETKKTEWSNVSGNYQREVRSDWQELCKKCHMKYDIDVLGSMSFQERGKRGGSVKSSKKGFGSNNELAIEAGRIGGYKSKRGKPKLTPSKPSASK